jgi:PIN domain nuclease of toxin-antitoxin system
VIDRPARAVLDASALLALLKEEAGARRVRQVVLGGALISSVNWAEVLTQFVEAGGDPVATARALPFGDVGLLRLVPFDDEQARESAQLSRKTRSLGLSLADRAALALARLRGLPVLTTDRAWRSLHLSIRIEVIR